MENTSSNENQDLGFGDKLTASGDRLIRKDGSFNVVRKGNIAWNTYQLLIGMSAGKFFLLMLFLFIAINAIFAACFISVGVEQLNGVPKGSGIQDFLYAFFFSIQTFTTVGYGGINPVGISANFISSVCASVGLVAFALITGLFFARFSRPRSHIAFSKIAILTPFRDGMSFQCRIVNKRDHKIINLSAQIVMTWLEKTGEQLQRRYAPLKLERSTVVLFPLNWTLVHPITSDSPLNGLTLAALTERHAEFMVLVSGFDESYHQAIHTNSSYICSEIEEQVRYKPMYRSSGLGATQLFLDDLSETERLS